MKFPLLASILVSIIPLAAQSPAAKTPFAEAVQAYQKGDLSSARMLFEAVVEADPGNQAARNFLQKIATQQGGDSPLPAMLKQIIIPVVDLQSVAPRDAFTFISQQVATQSKGKQNLNVVWLAPPDAGVPVTLALDNVPASEVLRYVAQTANLRLAFDRNAVKVLAPETP